MSEERGAIEEFRTDQKLHPMTLIQRLVVSLPGLLVLILTVQQGDDPTTWLYVIALGLYGFVAIPLMVLQYVRFRFRINRNDLDINSGVLTRRRRLIPIERIQNIEIQRPILARMTGTAKVRVETAGSSGAEGVLELISLDTAYRLRDAIRAYQRTLQTTPTEVEPDRAEHVASVGTETAQTSTEQAATSLPQVSESSPAPGAESLYGMDLGRVLLSGVFRFSLIYIAVMFSGLEYLNIDPVEIFDWVERGPLHPFAEFAAASPIMAIVASLALAGVVAWITGILVNLNRFYRFKLYLENEKLQNQQGLLTLHEATIPLKRIQVFVMRTNPLMRRFGWWALDVQTLGLDASRRGRSVVVPFARLDEVLAILRRLEPVAYPEVFESVSRLTIRRRFVRYALVLAGAAGLVSLMWLPAAWALAALPLLWLVAVAQYRNHGYHLTNDHLYVRGGVLGHQVWIIPTRKHQAFYASGTFFQRRLGLGTLQVDTAGAPTWRYPRIVDLPEEACFDRFDELVGRLRDGRNSVRRRALSTSPQSAPTSPPA